MSESVYEDMEKIGEFGSFLFEGYIVILLHKEWLDLFGEIPRFEIKLDNKRKLCIVSTKSNKYTAYTPQI